MDLKTYQASSMAEALEKVKKDLGREAVILHTRTIKRGGMFGVGAKTLVEITATRDVNVLHPSERRAVIARNQQRPSNGRAAGDKGGRSRTPSADAAAITRISSVPAEPVFKEESSLTTALRGEMGELRSMVRELLARPAGQDGKSATPDVPEELRGYYTRLVQNAVAEEIASDVVLKAKDRLKQWGSKPGEVADPVALQQLIPVVLSEIIERMLPQAEPVPLPGTPGATRYVALVGPTGVGKTTTIAKLAAHFKLREDKRVGLITIDTYRIAAVDQLRAYADILQVPLEIVLTPEEMRIAIERLGNCDLILIDTSGRSQRDHQRLDDLKAFLDVVRNLNESSPALETHLVLSCTSHPSQLMDVAQKFAPLGIDRVVFTKLDEAVGLGVILNVICRLNLRLSYLTTGQDVPDDIEVGHRRRIAQMVLDPNGPLTRLSDNANAPVDQLA